jgi:hypothetical protein
MYIRTEHSTLNSITDTNVEIKEDEKRKYMFTIMGKSQKLSNV